MIYSMTGFGRSEYADENCKITVEIKSVNHRYCDISVKLPRIISRFEPEIRKCIKKYAERGKIDVYISYSLLSSTGSSVKYGKDVAYQYISHMRDMADEFGITNDISVSTVGRFPDVFTVDESYDVDDEQYSLIERVIDEAGTAFKLSRQKEGENLASDIVKKTAELERLTHQIEELMPHIIEEYKTKLTEKVSSLLETADIDESRIVQEATIYADRVAVDEEMVRLASHIKAVRDIVQEGGAVGRKLDFIVQEMNREANTTLSKSDTLSVTDIGIDMKTCIEKIREQVQNIE